MHNAALRAMGKGDPRFREWRYQRFEISEEDLEEALETLLRKGFLGVNLTIPHKVRAVSLVDHIDATAEQLGAVNTLQRAPDGWIGFNTDGYGIEKAIRQELGVDLAGTTVIQLGAGGAARAVAVKCLQAGCRELWIGNRDPSRLNELLRLLEMEWGGRCPIHGFDLTQPPPTLPSTGLLINVTSLGLKPEDPSPIALERFSDALCVYDSTYGNPHNRLLADARDRGMRCADGLSMLVWQGVRALEIWSGAEVPADVMRRAAEEALHTRLSRG